MAAPGKLQEGGGGGKRQVRSSAAQGRLAPVGSTGAQRVCPRQLLGAEATTLWFGRLDGAQASAAPQVKAESGAQVPGSLWTADLWKMAFSHSPSKQRPNKRLRVWQPIPSASVVSGKKQADAGCPQLGCEENRGSVEEQRGCGLRRTGKLPTGDCRQLWLDGHACDLSWQLQDCSQWVTSP